jgi:hypothetical protein
MRPTAERLRPTHKKKQSTESSSEKNIQYLNGFEVLDF